MKLGPPVRGFRRNNWSLGHGKTRKTKRGKRADKGTFRLMG